MLSGRAVANGADDLLNLGKSAYTDPFLVSTLLSVHLPLFPGMKVKVWSNFSNELAQQVIAGTLDVAVITGVPDTSKLHLITITDNPFYVALSMEDELAANREVRLKDMQNRNWVLLGQHPNPYLFDTIQAVASDKGIHPSEIHPFTSPDEASELIREYAGLAFLPRTAAWRIARDGLTMRPLVEDRLRLVTKLAMRNNNKSRLVHEFVRVRREKAKQCRAYRSGKIAVDRLTHFSSDGSDTSRISTFRGPSKSHFGQRKIPDVSARPSNSSRRVAPPQCLHTWKCRSEGREPFCRVIRASYLAHLCGSFEHFFRIESSRSTHPGIHGHSTLPYQSDSYRNR